MANSMREIDDVAAQLALDELLDAVLCGESFGITRHGRRIARLEPVETEPNGIEPARNGQSS
jgi:antitoxin (DNA-binding transcriptional repressor) of toxin-antitoxin stability system